MGRLCLPRIGGARNTGRVVEPELDMQRPTPGRPWAIFGQIAALMRWMMPGTRSIAPPMRSIDRELWEISNDR